MRRLVIGFLIVVLSLISTVTALAASSTTGKTQIFANKKVCIIDGRRYTMGGNPIAKANGTILVPIKDLASILGLSPNDVIWKPGDTKISINTAEVKLTLQVGSNVLCVNNKLYKRIKDSPVLQNHQVYVPVQPLLTAIGRTWTWNPTNKLLEFICRGKNSKVKINISASKNSNLNKIQQEQEQQRVNKMLNQVQTDEKNRQIAQENMLKQQSYLKAQIDYTDPARRIPGVNTQPPTPPVMTPLLPRIP